VALGDSPADRKTEILVKDLQIAFGLTNPCSTWQNPVSCTLRAANEGASMTAA
jgi:hypothetical protein